MFAVPTRTQYGIRALAYLARKEGHEGTTAEIARSEGISPKYLEGIMGILKSAGLVHSERGKNGGVRLASEAASITMRRIVEALDGEVKPVDCVDSYERCAQGMACASRRFWIGLKTAVDAYLDSMTLDDVVRS